MLTNTRVIISFIYQTNLRSNQNTLDSNDEVKCQFDEFCECGEDFKCSKHELEEHLNKPFREIQAEIQRITNINYNRQLKVSGKVGGFKGFKILPNCEVGRQT